MFCSCSVQEYMSNDTFKSPVCMCMSVNVDQQVCIDITSVGQWLNEFMIMVENANVCIYLCKCV